METFQAEMMEPKLCPRGVKRKVELAFVQERWYKRITCKQSFETWFVTAPFFLSFFLS
jgi:hypothetical protein